jgi:hypothetical protein
LRSSSTNTEASSASCLLALLCFAAVWQEQVLLHGYIVRVDICTYVGEIVKMRVEDGASLRSYQRKDLWYGRPAFSSHGRPAFSFTALLRQNVHLRAGVWHFRQLQMTTGTENLGYEKISFGPTGCILIKTISNIRSLPN